MSGAFVSLVPNTNITAACWGDIKLEIRTAALQLFLSFPCGDVRDYALLWTNSNRID